MSIIKHVTLQKIVAHDFRYDPRVCVYIYIYIYIYIERERERERERVQNYITNAPTRFGASAPSSGSFDIAFAEVIKY